MHWHLLIVEREQTSGSLVDMRRSWRCPVKSLYDLPGCQLKSLVWKVASRKAASLRQTDFQLHLLLNVQLGDFISSHVDIKERF